MKLIKIQRFLNKTDIGISGKNGTEILLSSDIKQYFEDISKNQSIDCINLNDSSILTLRKKIEASPKFTAPNLKKYFSKYNIKEGDILELFILVNENSKSYYINFINTNVLLFKKNINNNEFFSLSESKLTKFLNDKNEVDIQIDNIPQKLTISKSEDIYLRKDGKEKIPHYKINVDYNMFIIDLDTKKIDEIEHINHVEFFENNKIEFKEEKLTLEQIKNSFYSFIKNKNIDELAGFQQSKIYKPLNKKNDIKSIISQIRPSSRIINTIGKDLIKDVYAAIIELVKNSYDADSKSVDIILHYDKKNSLLKTIVKDQGHGMSLETITDVWLVPATSDKLIRKRSPNGRFLQGKKGIGRYAAGMLGNLLLMESTDTNNNLSKVLIDFNEITNAKFLSDVDILIETGEINDTSGVSMEMTLSELSEHDVLEIWDEKQLDKLELELKKLKSPLVKYTDDTFDITLKYIDIPYKKSGSESILYLNKSDIIEPLPIVDYYDYRVHGSVNNNGKAILYYTNQNIENLKDEKVELQINLDSNRQYCGNIQIDYRVFDRDPESIDKLLDRGLRTDSIGKLEAKKLLDSMYGIGIYRDVFRIRPYGDQDYDWLDLDKVRVSNPSFNIGMNQIIGFIEIESENRSNLYEKSARDGLIENSNFLGLQDIAKEILTKVLQPKRFVFRQQVGRGRKVTNINEKIDNLFDFSSIENKVKSLGLTVANEEKIISIIDQERKSKEKDLIDIKNTIAVYQGQVTLGRMTDVILHEGRKSLRYLNEQLPRVNKWNSEYLDKPSTELKEKIKDRSLETISHAKDLSNLFKRIEPFSKGRLPNKKDTNIYDSIEKAVNVYETKLEDSNIDMINNIDKSISIYAREYDIYTAFVNFIENSIYWLNKSKTEDKQIVLKSEENEKSILIEMYDNGPGISEEYAYKAFDPGFSLKDGGTGLGMSIAAEALKRSSANVSIGESNTGMILYIKFDKGLANANN
ncbi:ATP-binding protein [Malaciobacter mytili]|uniref:sensor histidine kinase n=1 Tax=Malaciobacter mytili TaxID=603050 RepID=UPI00100BB47F|nr:sensor histidine kinase [Malaciobacter mytili]RXI45769.1 ATP-binding protein [Malaciobacter mytili]